MICAVIVFLFHYLNILILYKSLSRYIIGPFVPAIESGNFLKSVSKNKVRMSALHTVQYGFSFFFFHIYITVASSARITKLVQLQKWK